jgi:adenylosuccinate lyase
MVTDSDVAFADALALDDIVREALSDDEIAALLDPSTYLGATEEFIDAALAAYERELGRPSN